MGAPALDARDLVERLWREATIGESVAPDLHFPEEYPPLEHSEELRAVNRSWRLEVPAALPRAGSRWKHKAKERIAGVVLHLLHRYFSDEREFLAHVVRFDNQVAAAHDRLTEHVRLLAEQLEVTSRRLAERDDLLHRLLEERVERLEHGTR